ncbi:Auxin response factor 17 [Glycine max]|nr:Auxin response factor 17 [Glycine max]
MKRASPSHYLSLLICSLPFVPCRPFLRRCLRQVPPHSPEVRNDDDDEDCVNNGVVSFAKILTPSDANNDDGFSVLHFYTDSCFPSLDFRANPPVQLLSVADIHGVEWHFCHIYHGTPCRHLFTTGWSKFVNHKKLVASNTINFVKDSNGSVSVGIRCAAWFVAAIETPLPIEREDFRGPR